MPKIKVKGFGMHAAMSFAKFHTQHWSGLIDMPGHELDGKKIHKNVTVHKPFGKGMVEEEFIIEGHEDKNFTSVKQIIDHFKIT